MIIYCIEDINDLKYVGKTSLTLKIRFFRHLWHKYDKKRKSRCSSEKLHLEHSIIYVLEECEEEESKERESYWINKLDTVNQNRLNGRRDMENFKKWKELNKDKIKEKNKISNKKFRENNPDYNRIWSAQKWYCNVCNCEYNRSSKRLHLKSKKHLIQSGRLSDSQE